MAAVLLKKYIDAIIAEITTAFSNALASLQAQIDGLSPSTPSSGGVTTLWAPGTLNIASLTPFNTTFLTNTVNVIQNGTKTASIYFHGEQSTDNQSTPLPFGGYLITPPAAPYKVLFGYTSLPTSLYVDTAGSGDGQQSGSQQNTIVQYAGVPMGIGWSDGTNTLWFTPGINVPANYTTGTLSYYQSASINGTLAFSQPSLQAPNPLMYILSDDGNNVTISESVDGVNENIIFSAPKVVITEIDQTAFNNLAIVLGACDGQFFQPAIGGSMTNFYLYDPNVSGRLPEAPGY